MQDRKIRFSQNLPEKSSIPLKGTLLTTALKNSISGRTSKTGLKFYTTMFPAAFLTMDLDRNSFQWNEVLDKVVRCPDYCS